MRALTPQEKDEIIRCIQDGLPIPLHYQEALFPLPLFPSLIWDGKYTREKTEGMSALHVQELFFGTAHGYSAADQQPVDDDHLSKTQWRHLFFHADNAEVMDTLLHEPWKSLLQAHGGIQLIYIDPPFAVGSDFAMESRIGDGVREKGTVCQTAYRDSWGAGKDSFFSMLYRRLQKIHSLLAPTGSVYVHCDWRTVACTRMMLDEIFGAERFLGEIIWHYTGGGRAKRYFSRKHDTLLHYAKSSQWTFHVDAIRVPYKETSGYARSGIVSAAGKRYLPHADGTPIDDVWDIPIVNPMSHERIEYPTQKPERLLERIIAASSSEGDIVADFFAGSGTSLVVAQKMGRKWIGADSSPLALHTVRKRLQASEDWANDGGCQPFSVLRSGREPDTSAERIQGFSRVDVRIERFSDNVVVALAGAECDTRLAAQGIAWQDAIDYWGIDYAFGKRYDSSVMHMPSASACFHCMWQEFRWRKQRTLSFVAPAVNRSLVAAQICVHVVDIFARSTYVVVSV